MLSVGRCTCSLLMGFLVVRHLSMTEFLLVLVLIRSRWEVVREMSPSSRVSLVGLSVFHQDHHHLLIDGGLVLYLFCLALRFFQVSIKDVEFLIDQL